MEKKLKGDPLQCYLCLKNDSWVIAETSEEWCLDYHQEGHSIYFCTTKHRELWHRAKYLSWQAVALLQEFAASLRVSP